MDRIIQTEILAVEHELQTATGPFMPVQVAITRLCEAAVRVAEDKGERQAQITCAAARNVCARGLRERGTSSEDLERITDRTLGVITARLMVGGSSWARTRRT
jgi:hypothetical protein